MKHLKKNQLSLLLTALLLGLLISFQARSFENVSEVYGRDNRADVFREIQILKTTNEDLEDQLVDLEHQLSRVSDNQQALTIVREEIETYRALSGEANITGPGIIVKIQGNIRALWLTDIVNELLTAGAEAVSVNNIRLVNSTVGFDTIPSGQILLNSVILSPPYIIESIGERTVLRQALEQPQGIIERMSQNLTDAAVTIEGKDLIEMKKVL